MENTKKCPFCAETIQVEAIKCKHCGEMLNQTKTEVKKEKVVIVNSKRPKYSHGVAAILSLFIPGVGQMYKGNVGAGLLWLIIVAIGYAFFFLPGLVLHLICILSAGVSGDPYK